MPQHAEFIGNDYSGAYCFSPGNMSRVLPFGANVWAGGPPGGIVCGDSALVDTGREADLLFDVAFGGGGVHVDFSIIGYLFGGTPVDIFRKHLSGQSCTGPWVLSNDALGCNTHCLPSPAYGAANPGATVIIYPCQC